MNIEICGNLGNTYPMLILHKTTEATLDHIYLTSSRAKSNNLTLSHPSKLWLYKTRLCLQTRHHPLRSSLALLNGTINESSPPISPIRTSKEDSSCGLLESLEVSRRTSRAPASPFSLRIWIIGPVMGCISLNLGAGFYIPLKTLNYVVMVLFVLQLLVVSESNTPSP